MDPSLRCNSLKCRTTLDERAVVTTCSHIFCVACSESLGLANPSTTNGTYVRMCPACQTQLTNPDDAVVTQLNPTEDYKTSVLSGLSPSIIMECAGRGLAFYTYQATQEIVYQEYLARSLTDKYSTLSIQMDKVIHEANVEITSDREKLHEKDNHIRTLEQKNADLSDAFREKAKSLQQMRKLYESLKQQQIAVGMEMAADYDADDVLRAAAEGGHGIRQRRTDPRSRRKSNGSSDEGQKKDAASQWRSQQYPSQVSQTYHAENSRRGNVWEGQMHGNRTGLPTTHTVMPIPASPSLHRTSLLRTSQNALGPTNGSYGRPENSSQNNGRPPPLSSIHPNIQRSGLGSGYGMAAGVKVGRQPSAPRFSREPSVNRFH